MLTKTVKYMTSVAVAGGLTVAMTFAQTGAKQTANSLNRMDRGFVAATAQGGMAEVELGQLAEQKAADPAVKSFGEKMVADHTTFNDNLKTVAEKVGVTLPAKIDAKDQAEKDKLAQLSGPAFDRAYMKAMIQDHRGDIAEFRREAYRGYNESLKTYASTTLPKLRDHLRMAEKTNVKAEGSAS